MAEDSDFVEREVRRNEKTYGFRRKIDFVYSFVRSCAVCKTALPPVDLLCGVCWRELGRVINRGERLRQTDYPFPVYSLMTWTPQTEAFVKPLIYGFKGGRTIRASEKLATLFLFERFGCASLPTTIVQTKPLATQILSAPSDRFDHSSLWSHTLSAQMASPTLSPFRELKPRATSQKQLNQQERADRRYEIREQFAGSVSRSKSNPLIQNQLESANTSSKRIIFADDVITSGSTAMAAYMALGDPDQFEVWTLASRPRLAGK